MAQRELTDKEYKSIMERLEKEAIKRFGEKGWSVSLERKTKEDGQPNYLIMKLEERENANRP